MSAPILRRSQAHVATIHAPRMIAELAAYWEGKFPIAQQADGICITFPSGEVVLTWQADALLAQVASQLDDGLPPAQDIIADRLNRFADPAEAPLAFDWQEIAP